MAKRKQAQAISVGYLFGYEGKNQTIYGKEEERTGIHDITYVDSPFVDRLTKKKALREAQWLCDNSYNGSRTVVYALVPVAYLIKRKP